MNIQWIKFFPELRINVRRIIYAVVQSGKTINAGECCGNMIPFKRFEFRKTDKRHVFHCRCKLVEWHPSFPYLDYDNIHVLC